VGAAPLGREVMPYRRWIRTGPAHARRRPARAGGDPPLVRPLSPARSSRHDHRARRDRRDQRGRRAYRSGRALSGGNARAAASKACVRRLRPSTSASVGAVALHRRPRENARFPNSWSRSSTRAGFRAPARSARTPTKRENASTGSARGGAADERHAHGPDPLPSRGPHQVTGEPRTGAGVAGSSRTTGMQ
jgi:hypothetical protein